jgi:hypothetical protein
MHVEVNQIPNLQYYAKSLKLELGTFSVNTV